MKDLPSLFHAKQAGQPLGIRQFALQRKETEQTPSFHLDHLILQVTLAGHIKPMGSIPSHQGRDLSGREDKGREGCKVREDCKGREAPTEGAGAGEAAAAGAATAVLSPWA